MLCKLSYGCGPCFGTAKAARWGFSGGLLPINCNPVCVDPVDWRSCMIFGFVTIFDLTETDKARDNSSVSASMICGNIFYRCPSVKGDNEFRVFYVRPRFSCISGS